MSGVQGGPAGLPQKKGFPPSPQPRPAGQSPHWRKLPQPSLAWPHWYPSWAHVSGTQLPVVHWPPAHSNPGEQTFPQAPQLFASAVTSVHPLAHLTVGAAQGALHTLPSHTLGGGQLAGEQPPPTAAQKPPGSQALPAAQTPPGQQG